MPPSVRAFAQAPHRRNTEPFIVNALRRTGALTLSLVADRRHDAFRADIGHPRQASQGDLVQCNNHLCALVCQAFVSPPQGLCGAAMQHRIIAEFAAN